MGYGEKSSTPSIQYSNTPVFLIEDPEPSDSVEAFQGSGFFRSHQRGRHARFQLEHASVVHPLEEWKDMEADPTLFPKAILLLKSIR